MGKDWNVNAKTKISAERSNGRTRYQIEYKREWTVLIESEDVSGLNVMVLIEEIERVVGQGALLALRPKQNKQYEATLNSEEACERIEEGLKYGEETISVKRLHKIEVLVSFLHLPPEVPDTDIINRLVGWGVTPILPVRRRFYPGTNVADGTRFLKVKFPKEVASLPYSARFNTADGPQYCRVIHDKQVKLCRICLSPDHVLRDCPGFACRECYQQGHYARDCDAAKCPDCRRAMIRCSCAPSDVGEREEEQQTEDESSEQSEADGEEESDGTPENEHTETSDEMDTTIPCGQPTAEPVTSPGSTDIQSCVGSVDRVQDTGERLLLEAVRAHGAGQKRKETEQQEIEGPRQDEGAKVKVLNELFEKEGETLQHLLKKKQKKIKRTDVRLENAPRKQESRRTKLGNS